MPIIIEIAVSDGISTTEKGRLLEGLGAQILTAQQYEVTTEVRLTGMEVDILAKHKISGEEIFVECKAYREPFSADVITKLLGNVELRSVSSGWLITTAQLNKDGKGIQSDWEKKPSGEKRKLQFYTPNRIVNLLVDNNIICKSESLTYQDDKKYSEDKYLLITNYGRFWAVPLVNVEAGVPYAVILFDARNGNPINDSQIIEDVSHTDSSLEGLEWLTNGEAPNNSNFISLQTESQNIVAVAPGDQWTDYRPSRPQDFVGRKQLQTNIFQFLDSVRQGLSSTRLLAIKSPSGWGKSSILLKLIDRCGNKRNKSKYFMYAVDTRSATSARYGELALVACLRAAVSAGFVPPTEEPIRLASAANPLSDSTVVPLLNFLRDEQKVIVLFFDQFEEIFSKKDLSSLFDNIRSLCSAVDSVQENIVIGFSWKTDGSVPADHPAYYMWHNLADRRHEFSLSPFSPRDISEALTLFSRELDATLNPILKRHLADHCQGYPWLLKKLCIHVFDSVEQGIDQAQILGRSLNVKELFEKDENELTDAEIACLKHIATDSPAEFFHVQDVYGSDIVNSLINRRLVVRRGSRLTLYWDIFRDFVLTRSVPQIPVTYIPTATFGRYKDALSIILENGETNVADLASRLNLSEGTVENIVIDLVMVGNGERQLGLVKALQEDESESMPVIRDFLNRHILIRHLLKEEGVGFSISANEMVDLFPILFPNPNFTVNTWRQYVNRLIAWLIGTGVFTPHGYLLTHNSVPMTPILGNARRGIVRNTTTEFLAQAPPARVFETIDLINSGVDSVVELQERGYRNSLYILSSIRALTPKGEKVKLSFEDEPKDWIASQIRQAPAMRAAAEYISSYGYSNGEDVGRYVEKSLGAQWKPTSMLRYGHGLVQWYKWLEDTQVTFDFE